MYETDWRGPLSDAYQLAVGYLNTVPLRPVHPTVSRGELTAALDCPLPESPDDVRDVLNKLESAARPGLMNSNGGRFFGFVVGGANPAALATDWLVSTWDQNTALAALAPSATVIEEITARWLIQLLGLPDGASVGFVTGGQMANFTALAAARHEMLRRERWNVETQGLTGAPRVRILAGQDRHDTIDRAARFLGFGIDAIVPITADDQGRMRPDALASALSTTRGPVIVCAQAGGINTGAIDPIREICDLAHAHDAWVHVDGAFGLWAAASPGLSALVAGVENADSWATDGHKWLNVPYDSGIVVCAHPSAHRAAMGVRASFLIHGTDEERDPVDYTPELSRRARAVPLYATIRALGRQGIADLVERSCRLARRFADLLAVHGAVEIVNDVVLNQVLVRFLAVDGDHDSLTHRVITAVQREGTCWMSGTTWRGRAAMRISVSNWSTDDDDVERSAEAVLRCLDELIDEGTTASRVTLTRLARGRASA